MGFVHTLEVLYALVRVYATSTDGQTQTPLLSLTQEVPYPHLQQRLQQTLRAVALSALGAIFVPLVLLCVAPVLSPFAFPGFVALAVVCALLWIATVAQMALRYTLLPAPRHSSRSRSDPIVAMRGGLQTVVCAVVDAVTRMRDQPQLPVLFALCVVHTWLWKLVLYYGMLPATTTDAEAGAGFSIFVFTGGLIAFVSIVMVEKSLGDDPFALDPRAAFQSALQRDVVRAMRRGVLVYVAGSMFCWILSGSSSSSIGTENEPTTDSLFVVHAARMAFQITSSVLENLAVLSSASVFRILLFRSSYAAVDGAFGDTGNLWDSLAVTKPKEGDVMGALFASDVAVAPQTSTPLHEQYVQGLRKRVDAALKQIASRKTPAAPADAEDVESLDSLFKFENLLLACKFDADARASLFASRQRWHALFRSTTAVVDGFTLLLQLLNTLSDRKSPTKTNNPATGALALEQSVPTLLRFLSARRDTHPLLLLDQYPHLANLRIAATSIKSRIQFFIDSKLQFAVRRFLVEEARRRVFQRAKVHTVPAVLASLVECRKALDAYMETCLKDSGVTDIYVQEATALAKGWHEQQLLTRQLCARITGLLTDGMRLM
ncbi:hypothetical protein BBJ28_00008480 [Nothophytophthora sp. Chile5]|nr:hypothetical protein BBJ28_00008480 [Nothophytophthora sp. Chile5]